MIDFLLPTCEHLALIPDDMSNIFLREYATRLLGGEAKDSDLIEFISQIKKGLGFRPYCKKLDVHCVVMESVVMAQTRGYDFQSLAYTISNAHRIEECEDRIPESDESDGLLDVFLANHVLEAYRK